MKKMCRDVLIAHTDWLAIALADMHQIPQPKRGPKRDDLAVLNHYLRLVSNQVILNQRRHDQQLFGIYHIQRDKIKRQLGQYSQNNKRLYWLNWFEQQPWSLYTIVHKGNNFLEENTQVKLNFDFLTNLELESVPKEVIVEHYDQLNKENPDMVIATPIDTKSLQLYIDRTRESVNTKQRWSRKRKEMVWASPDWISKAETNLKTAVQIMTLTDNGQLTQPLKVSEFGRVYLGGVNLQQCSKTVRHAALGHCYSIDFSVCSTAWRLHTAQEIDAAFTAPLTLKLIKDKNAFRRALADVLGDQYLNRAKQILTSIGFGADINAHCWPMKNGEDSNKPAIKEIVGDEGLEILKNCDWFMQFIQEQTTMTDIICNDVFKNTNKQDMVDCVKDKLGRVQRNKVMAYLYQHAEAEYMAELLDYINTRFGRDQILLSVHDCVYLRQSVNMAEVNSRLQLLNPYLTAERTEHWGHFVAEDLLTSNLDPHQQQAQDFLKYWSNKTQDGYSDGSNKAQGYYAG